MSNTKPKENDFVIFEDDICDSPVTIETDFIEKCLKSEIIVVCNKNEYVSNTVMFEFGYLLAKNKTIEFIQTLSENWLMEAVEYFSTENNIKVLSKYR